MALDEASRLEMQMSILFGVVSKNPSLGRTDLRHGELTVSEQLRGTSRESTFDLRLSCARYTYLMLHLISRLRSDYGQYKACCR